jgi:hypothetical protein
MQRLTILFFLLFVVCANSKAQRRNEFNRQSQRGSIDTAIKGLPPEQYETRFRNTVKRDPLVLRTATFALTTGAGVGITTFPFLGVFGFKLGLLHLQFEGHWALRRTPNWSLGFNSGLSSLLFAGSLSDKFNTQYSSYPIPSSYFCWNTRKIPLTANRPVFAYSGAFGLAFSFVPATRQYLDIEFFQRNNLFIAFRTGIEFYYIPVVLTGATFQVGFRVGTWAFRPRW